MQITLVQGLLIALLVFICAIDKHMETFMWFRPLVVAFFTGIILGDVRLGQEVFASENQRTKEFLGKYRNL